MMFENISIEHYLYNTGTMEISFGSQGQIPVYLKQLLKNQRRFYSFLPAFSPPFFLYWSPPNFA